jgi:MbtH protein
MSEDPKPRPDEVTIDGDVFIVLINGEEQYSIWPAGKAIPEGWSRVGPTGSKAECLAFIEANWTDMRPKTLREP